MPHTPRIALDEVLDPGQEVTPEMAAKLLSYLDTILDTDQMADVSLILKGEEATSETPTMDQAMRRYATKAQARYAEKAQQRQRSSAAFDAMFPNNNRLAR